MVALSELVSFCDDYLQSARIKDYCPNGLQVEGGASVRRIVGGVTASQALIDAAIARKADLVLVHHGYFWKGESASITGIKQKRIKALLAHDVSLLAYHLPLDVHAEVGNNVQLADKLDLIEEGPMVPGDPSSVGLRGRLAKPMSAGAFAELIKERLQRDCLHIGHDEETIETIAWCTGAAQGMISQAVDLGVDAYLSGEISEPTFHIARETGVHYFSAGHHATERYGVQALGAKLSQQFDIDFEFVDIDNPV